MRMLLLAERTFSEHFFEALCIFCPVAVRVIIKENVYFFHFDSRILYDRHKRLQFLFGIIVAVSCAAVVRAVV